MKRLILILILALATLAGCGDGQPDGPQAFAVRPFLPVESSGGYGHGVCYGPHRDGQRPGGIDPTAAELREDLAIMSRHWNLLRVYSATGVSETLLKEIRAGGLDMMVILGVWIAPNDPQANAAEVAAAIRLANAYPEVVVAVSVGNETQIDWSAHRSPVGELIEHVRQVRAGVKIPVTVADDYNYWNKPESRTLSAELDFILLHAHPLWNGVQLEDALPWLKEQLAVVNILHSNRAVVVGETGWATSVHTEGEQAELIKGTPGEAEQKIFHDEVRAWATDQNLPVFFFEAFDENWKGGEHPAEVEKHWGLYRADRTPKLAVRLETP